MYILFIFIWITSLIIFARTVQHINCPHLSHWNKRSKDICNITSAYHCLYDENNYSYVEFCREKPYFESRGFKVVVLGDLNGRMCDHSRFQPFIFWTNGSSKCAFSKSTCSEEGQVIISNGTTIKDRSCRCDYRRGYSFVTERSNLCSCVPSEEDCTCYSKLCPVDHELNQDYECKPVGSCRNQTRCSELPWHIETTVKPTMTTTYETDDLDTNASNSEHNVLMVVLLFVLSFAMMTGGTLLALADKDGIHVCLLRDQSLYQHKKKQTTPEDMDVKSDQQLPQNKSTQTVLEETTTLTQTSETADIVLVHQSTVEMPTDVDRILISQTKLNYLRLVFLIQVVAPRAVRKLFDGTFGSRNLQSILKTERYLVLDRLRQRRFITKNQWDVMFPATGSVISESFDLGLMICLLRNLQQSHSKEMTASLADLDSLNKYRCLIINSSEATLTHTLFNEYWNNLTKLIVRVGGEGFAKECEDLKSGKLDFG